MWEIGIIIGGAVILALTGNRPVRRRQPSGPRIEAERGPWSAIPDRDERLRKYARDLFEAYDATDLPSVSVELAVAHSMMATGAWMPDGPRVWNNNIAVARAQPSWTGPWVALGTWEVLDDRGTPDPGDDVIDVQSRQAWRAYDTLAEGARAAVAIWKSRRYRRADALLRAGDASWSRALGEAGYYTANPEHFERVYRDRLAKVRRLLSG